MFLKIGRWFILHPESDNTRRIVVQSKISELCMLHMAAHVLYGVSKPRHSWKASKQSRFETLRGLSLCPHYKRCKCARVIGLSALSGRCNSTPSSWLELQNTVTAVMCSPPLDVVQWAGGGTGDVRRASPTAHTPSSGRACDWLPLRKAEHFRSRRIIHHPLLWDFLLLWFMDSRHMWYMQEVF